MHSSSRLWGMMATGLVLVWGSGVLAQSPGSPNASPTNAAPRPAVSSTVRNSLICDSFAQVCITVGKRGTGSGKTSASAAPAMPRPAASPPVVAPSPSLVAAPQIQRPNQQEIVAAPRSMICNASGKICAAASGKRGTSSAGTAASAPPAGPRPPASPPVAAPTPSLVATPEIQRPKQQSIAAAPRPLICDASGKICTSASVQPSRIDGIGSYDGLVAEDPFNWVVHAYKAQHRIEVFFRGHLFKTYHAVFGRSLAAGAKLWEGDRRTPEGSYLIIGKHRSARFGWFLHLNYPNQQDHQRFEESRAAHLIPTSAHEGGQIGIHGTDSPYLNVSEVDWTTGCISVDNDDIQELARLLPVGTLVIINP
jgi:hypothetical protein